MTNGDKIREMDDWNLAVLFTAALSEYGRILCEKLERNGISVDLVEMPVVSQLNQFVWLQQETDDE